MKNVLLLGVAAFVFLATGDGFAGEKGSWVGWIADSNCAKDYAKAANPEHAACAKRCVGGGADWALATEAGHFILQLEEAEKHLGHEVVIEGELDEESNTITVADVKMSEDSQ